MCEGRIASSASTVGYEKESWDWMRTVVMKVTVNFVPGTLGETWGG
jgi:hypothetical protein